VITADYVPNGSKKSSNFSALNLFMNAGSIWSCRSQIFESRSIDTGSVNGLNALKTEFIVNYI
jgi:hypothetical protein